MSPTHRQRAEELLGQVSVRSSDDALTAAGVNATLALCDAFNALAVVLAAQRSTPPTPQVNVAFAPGVASMDGA